MVGLVESGPIDESLKLRFVSVNGLLHCGTDVVAIVGAWFSFPPSSVEHPIHLRPKASLGLVGTWIPLLFGHWGLHGCAWALSASVFRGLMQFYSASIPRFSSALRLNTPLREVDRITELQSPKTLKPRASFAVTM